MTTLVTSIGQFFTGAIGWLGEVFDVIEQEPIAMLLVVAVPLSGWAFGGIRRLIRL